MCKMLYLYLSFQMFQQQAASFWVYLQVKVLRISL